MLSVRYGPRVVCSECAKHIDRENRRAELAPYFELLALLGLLFILYAAGSVFRQ